MPTPSQSEHDDLQKQQHSASPTLPVPACSLSIPLLLDSPRPTQARNLSQPITGGQVDLIHRRQPISGGWDNRWVLPLASNNPSPYADESSRLVQD
ncbi:hypothetical protein BaRGS_00000568 [Batillaria attramentaria]|uniref:Uncharacterized protein n=1 Tax=Batillaria attramentaria TaxID=370345 RepID=A0ABD0MA25_9CAEN